MPIFEYHCLVCNREFETLVRTSTPAVKCSHCGSELLEKKFSLFGAKVGQSVDAPSAGSMGSGGGACGCGHCTCQ